MENNFENMPPEADFIPEEVVSGTNEVDSEVPPSPIEDDTEALLNAYTDDSEQSDSPLIPEVEGAIDPKAKAEKKQRKKAKKTKPKKEPKAKKEPKPPKPPKEKKEPRVKKSRDDSLGKHTIATHSKEQLQSILSKRKKLHLLNFSRKLTLLCIVPLIILCIIISVMSTQILRSNLEDEIESSLKIVAVSLEETYSNLYKGDYSMGQSGKLYKGETVISGNTSLIDTLKENTGFDSSFYFGKRVIVTTILRMQDGKPAGGKITGTDHMTDEVYQIVVEQGQELFCTDYVLQDVKYYAYFSPLVNSDGSIAGCIFVGKPSAEVNAKIVAETNKITIFSILVSIACVALILIVTSNMSKTMVRTKNFLEIVSTGDLTQSASAKYLSRDDELGDMYAISYALQEELKGIVSSIKISADDLSASSEQLTGLSQDTVNSVAGLYDSVEFISKGAADQADQTSVAAIQVSNIGDQIDSISEDVTSLSDSANKMAEAEQASTTIINELNASNEDVIDSIEKIANQIEITNTSVQEIRAAIAMIQSISDETDLLSINASIEAAHAGDAGRGFAVVAEQISKLAAQSGNNATEIEKIINTLLEQSGLMVRYMNDVKIKISEQREKLNLTIDKFSAVADGVNTSLVNIENITNGMNELRKSRDVILDIISDLSAVSQQYAASTSGTIETAQSMSDAMKSLDAASEKLKAMSDDLTRELEIFKL